MLTMQSEFGTLLLLLMIFLTFIFLFVPDLRIFFWTVGVIAVLALVVILAGIQIGRWEDPFWEPIRCHSFFYPIMIRLPIVLFTG